MKDKESVKDYSGRLMDVVYQMPFLGEAFTYQKSCKKKVSQKFDSKIFAMGVL